MGPIVVYINFATVIQVLETKNQSIPVNMVKAQVLSSAGGNSGDSPCAPHLDLCNDNVISSSLRVDLTKMYNYFNVQNVNLHVHSVNDINNVNDHYNYLHVHNEECNAVLITQ